jgi:UDP-N-acetylglucosamine transferase subunit ALG13
LIFVTVGTHHQPFRRLLDALEPLDPADLVVQHGPSEPPPGVARAERYMPFDAMLRCFEEADAVITHAGVGSILCARREGHVPLVVPRRHELGEHLDEHQAELTRALEAHRKVIAVWDAARLPELLDEVPPRGKPGTPVDSSLGSSVRAALLEGRGQASEA